MKLPARPLPAPARSRLGVNVTRAGVLAMVAPERNDGGEVEFSPPLTHQRPAPEVSWPLSPPSGREAEDSPTIHSGEGG